MKTLPAPALTKAATQLGELIPRSRLHPAVLAWAEAAPRRGRWGVAFSGGPDSLALLLLLWAHWPERRRGLTALHFDHRLRGAESTADARFCRGICRALGVAFVAGRWAGRHEGASEAEAREEMLKELAKFTVEMPGADELDRAKNYLAGQTEVGRMSAAAVASEIAEAWLSGNGLEEMEAPWDRYREVTAEEVLAVARASFDPSRRAEGVVRGKV